MADHVMEYQIQANTRRCTSSGRELRPGERFFSVLIDANGQLERQDFAAECWTGAPPGAFGFWRGRVSVDQDKRRPPIDDELLLECLERLTGQDDPGRVSFRYVVALLLMRRKKLRLEQSRHEAGQEILSLKSREGKVYEVVKPALTDDEMIQVQDEVFHLLGWD